MNLKSIRLKLDLTQEQVAEIANISQPYYNEIEKGKKTPAIPVAVRIASALKVSPAIFFQNNFAKSDKNVG